MEQLSKAAKQLELDVLLKSQSNWIGEINLPSLLTQVNNRNLKTFEVSLDTSRDLAAQIPADFIKVSESGISQVEAIQDLKQYGYQGFW